MRYSILGILFLVFGCAERSVELDTDRLGLQYFPLEVGTFRIYDVFEKNYTVLEVKELNYQLRESVQSKALDINNDTMYILHRETRNVGEENWNLDSVWSATKNTYQAIVVENNLALVKLAFPIDKNVFWNGNAYNARENEFYSYDLNVPDTTLYDSLYTELVKVVQNDRKADIFGRDQRFEIFAPHVGLIIKESIIWQYCQLECDGDFTKIEAGREYRQTLKTIGLNVD